jgi:hypothetical protein
MSNCCDARNVWRFLQQTGSYASSKARRCRLKRNANAATGQTRGRTELPSRLVRVFKFDEAFVDPTSAVVPAPDLAPHQPSRDRSPRDEDGPEVPHIRPGRLRPGAPPIGNLVFVRLHEEHLGRQACQLNEIAGSPCKANGRQKICGACRHKCPPQTGKLNRELSLMFASDVKAGTGAASLKRKSRPPIEAASTFRQP